MYHTILMLTNYFKQHIGKLLIALLGITSASAYVGNSMFGVETKVTLENGQQVVWQKPTTDAEWAEDVKAEGFEHRADAILQEMIDVHKAKLLRVIEGNRETLECMECVKFRLKQANPDWSQTDIDNEYLNQKNQATWDIEKLKQSVERMENEMRLRKAGKVNRRENILRAKPSTEREKIEIEKLK